MASLPRPRKRSTPATGQRRRYDLINRYFLNYEQDAAFMAELTALACDHGPALAAFVDKNGYGNLNWRVIQTESKHGKSDDLRTFAHAADELVTAWGLHLLPEQAGYEAVMNECYWSHVNRRTPARLHYSQMTGLPLIEGASPARPGTALQITLEWPFLDEKPSVAEARMKEAITAFVNDATGRLQAAGYEYHDPQETAQYLSWLYRRVAHREPVHKIATDVCKTENTVETLTKDYARHIGIRRIPDNRESRRGTAMKRDS